jgi:hypothetical protein
VAADTITVGSTPAATDISDVARWSVMEGMLGPLFSSGNRCFGVPSDHK